MSKSDAEEKAEILIKLLAIELEKKFDDVIKESLPKWQYSMGKEKYRVLGAIGKVWWDQYKQKLTKHED